MLEKAAGKYQGVQAGFVDDIRPEIGHFQGGHFAGLEKLFIFLIVYMVGQLEPRTLKNLSPLEASSPVLVKTCVLLTG